MAAPIVVWLEITHHGAFRVGGWALVRRAGAEVSGLAGGARRADAERIALLGLLAALGKPGEAAAPIEVRTSSALVAGVPAKIAAAQAGEDAPTDNLDLWAQAQTRLAAGGAQVRRTPPPAAGGPGAFAAAWAELAREKAKGEAPFTFAIPKPNLARAGAATAD